MLVTIEQLGWLRIVNQVTCSGGTREGQKPFNTVIESELRLPRHYQFRTLHLKVGTHILVPDQVGVRFSSHTDPDKRSRPRGPHRLLGPCAQDPS